MADDEEMRYRWETEYREALVEYESGSLQASITDIFSRAKRRYLLDKVSNVRLGMEQLQLKSEMHTTHDENDEPEENNKNEYGGELQVDEELAAQPRAEEERLTEAEKNEKLKKQREANTESSLIKMVFPDHSLTKDNNTEEKVSMCMCHLDRPGGQGFGSNGYFCPQCNSKYCELPRVQSLWYCFGCQVEIVEPRVYKCEKCGKLFCLDCDLFTHHTLHSCPGCAGKTSASATPLPRLPVS